MRTPAYKWRDDVIRRDALFVWRDVPLCGPPSYVRINGKVLAGAPTVKERTPAETKVRYPKETKEILPEETKKRRKKKIVRPDPNGRRR